MCATLLDHLDVGDDVTLLLNLADSEELTVRYCRAEIAANPPTDDVLAALDAPRAVAAVLAEPGVDGAVVSALLARAADPADRLVVRAPAITATLDTHTIEPRVLAATFAAAAPAGFVAATLFSISAELVRLGGVHTELLWETPGVPAQWATSAQGPAKEHFAAVTGQLSGRLAGCGPEAWMLLCELVDGFEGSLSELCATAAAVSTPDACTTEGWEAPFEPAGDTLSSPPTGR